MVPISVLAELLGESRAMRTLRERVGRLLQTLAGGRRLPPVLIQGETGTGKGVLARAMHRAGPGCQRPFVSVNCAAIPGPLLEAELFGFERGAFTDARRSKPGLFQMARSGTILLDEIGLLPEELQGKVLHVVEERHVRRLGSTQSEPLDVWIMSASNEDLALAARTHRFREDLYHRLAVLTLWLPPLRERENDVLELAEYFLGRSCADYELPPKRLGPDARAALLDYPWPGNLRELSNVMERAVLFSGTEILTAEDLGLITDDWGLTIPSPRSSRLGAELGEIERARLLEALRNANGKLSRAAVLLGMPRNTVRYRMERLGLWSRPRGTGQPRASTTNVLPD